MPADTTSSRISEPTERASEATAVRWVLRPGAPVLRRDATTVQVGLDHPSRVLLPDSAAVRTLLSDLRDQTGRAGPGARSPEAACWARLRAADLLVPVAGPARAAAPGAPDGVAAGVLRATRAWAGTDAERRVAARAAMRVRLSGPGDLAVAAGRLLRGTGVVVLDHAGGPGGAGVGGAADGAGLVVVAVDGEVRRGVVDPLVAHGTPHLVLWARGGLPRVGPLVVPGVTACLRCLDAHDAEDDPRRPLLLEQAADQPPDPHDPVLAALAAAWAARDVLRLAEGVTPTTWSATLTVTPDGPPVVRSLARHPHCGCAWDVDPVTG